MNTKSSVLKYLLKEKSDSKFIERKKIDLQRSNSDKLTKNNQKIDNLIKKLN